LRSSNRASQLSQAEFIPRERFSPLGVSGPNDFPLSFAPRASPLPHPRALLCPAPMLLLCPAPVPFLTCGGGVPGMWRRRSWRRSLTSKRVAAELDGSVGMAAELDLQGHGGGARRWDPMSWRGATRQRDPMSSAGAGLAGGGSSRRRGWQSSSQISRWTRLLFNFIARDPIAFCFVCRDLIALSYSVAWLSSCSLPNIIPTEPSSSHTTYQTGQDKTHLCLMGIAVLGLVEVR
jgi:hypothetical protein